MKYVSKLMLFIGIIIIFSASITAATISDQATNVKIKSSGQVVQNGNLSVYIWNQSSGGTLIYSYTFTNVINNGSWNIMLGQAPGPNLSLEHNKYYWKDYEINGEDVDFLDGTGATVERQIFQSPFGNSTSSEIDPVFTASPANGISSGDISDWNTAYGWGNHASAGYLTNESDPTFVSSPAYNIGNNNISNWNTAYSWGNPSGVYLPLSGGTITGDVLIVGDLVVVGNTFNATVINQVINGSILPTIDNTFTLGDPSAVWSQIYGYINYSYIQNAPVDQDTLGGLSCSDNEYIRYNGTLSAWECVTISGSGPETDPVFIASPAYNIGYNNISDWNTAYSWGNHALAGYLMAIYGNETAFNGWDKDAADDFTTANETDPVWSSEKTNYYNKTEVDMLISSSNMTIYGNETAFDGWDKNASDDFTTANETDPVFQVSAAYNIGNNNISDWNTAYGWGNHALVGYLTAVYGNETAFTGWDKDTTDDFTTANETDPIFAAENVSIYSNISARAYPGNCPDGYYVQNTTTSGVQCLPLPGAGNETDPVFQVSAAYNIGNNNISDWNTAYSWGDHALAGYLTTFTIYGNETAFDGWDKNVSDDFNGSYAALSGAPTTDNITIVNNAGVLTGNYTGTEGISVSGNIISIDQRYNNTNVEYTMNLTVTGNGTNISTSAINYVITRITVIPQTNTTSYKFRAAEYPSDEVIDQDRAAHVGTWDIRKFHALNSQVNVTISNAAVDEPFNIVITYLNNEGGI